MYYKGQIGSAIRQIRQSAGISQFDENLTKIETARWEPTLAYCEKVSERLHVQLGQLLSTSQTARPILVLDPFVEEIAGMVKRLSPPNRSLVLQILSEIA